jgi:hypothetical protein
LRHHQQWLAAVVANVCENDREGTYAQAQVGNPSIRNTQSKEIKAGF